MSLVLNLPHDARHDVEPLGLGLNPNDGALAEDLAHDDLVDVLDVLVKAEAPARLEDAPYLGDDDLWIEGDRLSSYAAAAAVESAYGTLAADLRDVPALA